MKLRGTQTEKNLLLAYHGESNNRNLYTYFADRAREDGYEQIAAVFLETADHERAELVHPAQGIALVAVGIARYFLIARVRFGVGTINV